MSDESIDKPLVLVVDNDEDICTYLSVLIHDSADTIKATNGDKGIELAESELPDLILLDLMMPGTDGYQVCKTLKRNPETRHIPIVFITAQTDRGFEAAALKLGAIDYVVKPFDTEIVASKVKNYLSMLHQGEELNTVLRHRRGRYLVYGACAALLAGGIGYFTHGYLDLWKSSREQARIPAAAQPAPAPSIALQAPRPQAAQSEVAQSRAAPESAPPAPLPASPPLPAPRLPAPAPAASVPTPTPTPAPGPAPVPPVAASAPSGLTALQETGALADSGPKRAFNKYDWVRDAHCGVIPLVDWWQNVTPNSIAEYIEKHHEGQWGAYTKKWSDHLVRTENTMARGGALKAPNGTILQGAKLREFVAKLRKRVDVVQCLARAASRHGSFGE